MTGVGADEKVRTENAPTRAEIIFIGRELAVNATQGLVGIDHVSATIAGRIAPLKGSTH